MLFRIGHAAGEFFPTGDVLHLIQKEIALFIAELDLHRQQVVEVRNGELGKALVLKVDVDDLFPIHTGRHQIQHNFIQQRGLARTAQTYQHIIAVFFKLIIARHDLKITDKFMLVVDDGF